jgi:hypothetical protein
MMSRSPKEPPAGLAEWHALVAKWKEETSAWVRKTLSEYFATDDGSYEPHTAGEIVKMLDERPDVPVGWSRLLDSTPGYQERYAHVRNTLEHFARKRLVTLGTTINSRGNDQATTYARPYDASREWSIVIAADTDTAHNRARAEILEWLSLEGAALDGVTSVQLTKKGDAYGGGKARRAVVAAQGRRRRNPAP